MKTARHHRAAGSLLTLAFFTSALMPVMASDLTQLGSGTTGNGSTNTAHNSLLRGEVSFSAPNDMIGSCIEELVSVALLRDERASAADMAVHHYNKPLFKVIKGAKDAINYMLCDRGFGPSIEVGKVVLDEGRRVKSKDSAELCKQKHFDETNLKVVSSVMQLSMGLGTADSLQGAQTTTSALSSLEALVGRDQANKALVTVAEWARSIKVPQAVYSQKVWDIQEQQDKIGTVISSALNADPVVDEVRKRVRKYSRRRKIVTTSASVLETSLNLASLTPTMVGPAAQAVLLAFLMGTGGPEEDKLIREVYLDKRLQSRAGLISHQATMAMNAYQMALLTRNPALLSCSESIVRRMSGAKTACKVFGVSVLRPTGNPVQIKNATHGGEAMPGTAHAIVQVDHQS